MNPEVANRLYDGLNGLTQAIGLTKDEDKKAILRAAVEIMLECVRQRLKDARPANVVSAEIRKEAEADQGRG